MSRSSEAYQEQQEQENLSGADDFEEWLYSIESSYICPYCFSIKSDPVMCCGEIHMRKVSEMSKEEKEDMR